ncbi:MAG: Hsp20/alpha crystallin family protein [Firmicutes bacterium]|nr:Hsp20/alpha crystallin family protein [Bacillota bacterium]
MGLFRYDPARELLRLRDSFGRFMEYPFRAMRRETGPWQPSVDVFERGNDIVLRAEVPGVAPGDLDIRVTQNSVSLKGVVQREERTDQEGYYYSERQYGSFYRSIPLPDQVRPEKSRATYVNGILELVMPRETDGREAAYRVPVVTETERDDIGRTQ